LHNASI